MCKQIEVTEQTLGDEVLKREIFYALEEARFIIERWRQEYNQIRPPQRRKLLHPGWSRQEESTLRN